MKKLLLLGVTVLTFVFANKTNAQVDIYLDNLNVYVTEYGRVALYSLPDTIRQVYRTALLVGTGPDAVFDLIWDLEVEEPTTLLSTPSFGDYEVYGSYNNDYSGAPPNAVSYTHLTLPTSDLV